MRSQWPAHSQAPPAAAAPARIATPYATADIRIQRACTLITPNTGVVLRGGSCCCCEEKCRCLLWLLMFANTICSFVQGTCLDSTRLMEAPCYPGWAAPGLLQSPRQQSNKGLVAGSTKTVNGKGCGALQWHTCMASPRAESQSTQSQRPSGDGSALLMADANLPTAAVEEKAAAGHGAINVCTAP